MLALYNIKHREKEMSDNKYLIVCQGEELEIFQYVRIIANSETAYSLHLMEFKHKVEDDDIMYYYTVGDRTSLRELAETKGLSARSFLSAISSVAHALSEADKYGLAQECFIIDSSFVYIGEVDTLLAYVPFEINVDPKEEFRRLMNYISDKLIDGQKEFQEINAITKYDFSFSDICRYFNDVDVEKNTEEEYHSIPASTPANIPTSIPDIPVNIPPNTPPNIPANAPINNPADISQIHGHQFNWGEPAPLREQPYHNFEEPGNAEKPKEPKPKKEGFFGRKKKKETPPKQPKPPKPPKKQKVADAPAQYPAPNEQMAAPHYAPYPAAQDEHIPTSPWAMYPSQDEQSLAPHQAPYPAAQDEHIPTSPWAMYPSQDEPSPTPAQPLYPSQNEQMPTSTQALYPFQNEPSPTPHQAPYSAPNSAPYTAPSSAPPPAMNYSKQNGRPAETSYASFEDSDLTLIDDEDGMTMIDETVYLLCNSPIDDSEKEKVIIETTPFTIRRKYPGPGSVGDSDLFIARRYISARHAVITKKGNAYYVADIGTYGKGSKGGTFVNGALLPPNVETFINSGDVIRFYKLEYTFHVD